MPRAQACTDRGAAPPRTGRLERARRLPDPTLSLGVKRSQELGRNQILLGVSMPIPLFDSNAGNQLQALKQYEKAQDELAATRPACTPTRYRRGNC